MKKNILLAIIILFGITACGGGGGGGSGPNPPAPAPPSTVNLVPLKIAMLDLNDNPIAYFDISKIGSHLIYKLQFTNPNPISINAYNFAMPDYYSTVQAQKKGISVESYEANYQAAGIQYGDAIKTSNSDDCFNQMQDGTTQVLLAPGASCSYYTYFANLGNNHSNKDTFTVPVSYTIADPNSAVNSLDVVQCSRSGMPPNPFVYDCSNMSKPGFAEQFITYKALPINGNTNFVPANPYGHNVSKDGNWFWSCTTTNCNKYALNYDSTTNTLTQSMTSTAYTVHYSGRNIADLYVAPDGSNVWVSSYSKELGFALVNTSNPNVLFDDGGMGNYVPDMDTTVFADYPNGVVGLDGSFWWSTGIGADIYDPVTQSFIKTNIDDISGVNADGTVIGFYNGKAACFDRGPDYTSYIYRGQLLNYTAPSKGSIATNYGQNVYMLMYVPGIVHYSGVGVALEAYYKVHTENGKCEINLDDYTLINNGFYNGIDQYLLSTAKDYSTPFQVISAANVYYGL
ncbi:MAG: hypothetical protein K0R14_210 [Burkholderiales bacterium]|jgi:hypothetical protein|nr:hypothetical protein [Burkholderiales bacterium]